MKVSKLKKYVILSGGAFVLFSWSLPAQEATISINASKVENKISPYLYGACIEDVNHEIYGGLYDQKIFGESFEEPVRGFTFDHFTAYEGYWQPQNGGVKIEAYPGQIGL